MTPLAICNLRLDSPRGCALLMAWHPWGDQWMIISRAFFLGGKRWKTRQVWWNIQDSVEKTAMTKLSNHQRSGVFAKYSSSKTIHLFRVFNISPAPDGLVSRCNDFIFNIWGAHQGLLVTFLTKKTWSGCIWLEIARLLGHERTRLNKIWSNSASIKVCLQLITSYTWMHQLEVSIFRVTCQSNVSGPDSSLASTSRFGMLHIDITRPSGRSDRVSLPSFSKVGDLRILAQKSFQKGFLSLITAEGQVGMGQYL